MTNKRAVEVLYIATCWNGCGRAGIDDLKEAIKMARAALYATEWISVNDRLPEVGERVLATDGAFVGEMYINKRGRWQRYNVNDSALLMALDILWWMPLPEPPKEGA